jgi:hypothetical protein
VGVVQAKDRAEKYIQPDCKTVLVVTKVERIENQPRESSSIPLEISEWLFYGGPDVVLDRVMNKLDFRAAKKKVHYTVPCNLKTSINRNKVVILSGHPILERDKENYCCSSRA